MGGEGGNDSTERAEVEFSSIGHAVDAAVRGLQSVDKTLLTEAVDATSPTQVTLQGGVTVVRSIATAPIRRWTLTKFLRKEERRAFKLLAQALVLQDKEIGDVRSLLEEVRWLLCVPKPIGAKIIKEALDHTKVKEVAARGVARKRARWEAQELIGVGEEEEEEEGEEMEEEEEAEEPGPSQEQKDLSLGLAKGRGSRDPSTSSRVSQSHLPPPPPPREKPVSAPLPPYAPSPDTSHLRAGSMSQGSVLVDNELAIASQRVQILKEEISALQELMETSVDIHTKTRLKLSLDRRRQALTQIIDELEAELQADEEEEEEVEEEEGDE